MRPNDDVDRIVAQHAAFDHRGRAAERLFGRLEEQRELSGELLLTAGEKIGDAEESRGMDVVSARVHDAVVHRREGDLILFDDGKPSMSRANHDPSTRLGAPQDRDGAGLSWARRQIPPEFDEASRERPGSCGALETTVRDGREGRGEVRPWRPSTSSSSCGRSSENVASHSGMVLTTTEKKSKVGRLRWKVCNNAAVAQRIRASVYGTEGRGFESLQPHQLKANKDLDDGDPQCWCCHLSKVLIVFIAVLMTPRVDSENCFARVGNKARKDFEISLQFDACW